MEKVEFLKFLPLSYQPPTSDVMEVKLELGLDGFVGMRGMTLVGGDIPNRSREG